MKEKNIHLPIFYGVIIQIRYRKTGTLAAILSDAIVSSELVKKVSFRKLFWERLRTMTSRSLSGLPLLLPCLLLSFLTAKLIPNQMTVFHSACSGLLTWLSLQAY